MWGSLQVEGVEDPKMSERDNEGNQGHEGLLGNAGRKPSERWRVGSDE